MEHIHSKNIWDPTAFQALGYCGEEDRAWDLLEKASKCNKWTVEGGQGYEGYDI